MLNLKKSFINFKLFGIQYIWYMYLLELYHTTSTLFRLNRYTWRINARNTMNEMSIVAFFDLFLLYLKIFCILYNLPVFLILNTINIFHLDLILLIMKLIIWRKTRQNPYPMLFVTQLLGLPGRARKNELRRKGPKSCDCFL